MESDLNELITNLDSVDVDDNTTPQWARALIKSMKGLFNILKNYDELSQRVEVLESTKSLCENNTTLLQQENVRLNNLIVKLEARVDDHEQRNRNSCLLIHGVDERNGESTDNIALGIINNDLGLNFKEEHIQRSHRLGVKREMRNTTSTKSYPRPIIVKFLSYRGRQAVFTSKKKLKGKNISISENLTHTRYVLLKAASEKLGRGNVWSSDGRIMSKINDRYVNITSLDVLDSL